MANVYKSSLGGGTSSSGINYSTSEQDTGLKWIDNKTIYQRTINIGGLKPKQFSHGISNINIVVDSVLTCVSNNPSTNGHIQITGGYAQLGLVSVCLAIDGSKIHLIIKDPTGADLDFNSVYPNCYITLQYTKN